MVGISYDIKHFNKLSTRLFHDIVFLREEIFVLEQNCIYQDVDGKDLKSYHAFAADSNNNIVATCRVIEPDNNNTIFIGRVACKKEFRRFGIGNKIMKNAIFFIKEKYPDSQVKISAQKYLLNFYSSLGFIAYGEEYLEDNIPHRSMYLS